MPKKKEFVISDESRNSYGFVVLTAGINIDRFIQNPVMFYNHDREGGVIGRWENIRLENDILYATPVFDEADELGQKISQKVENGFIRAASIGIEPLIIEELGEIVASCDLIECSICDIPSNRNALMVYHNGIQVKDKAAFIKLNLIKTPKPMTVEEVKKITEALGLKPEAAIDEILSAIESLSGDTPKTIVENAIKMKAVKPYEMAGLMKMATVDLRSFKRYIEDRMDDVIRDRRVVSLALINEAIKDGRLSVNGGGPAVRAYWLNAFLLDFEGSKAALVALNARPVYSTMIKNNKATPGDRTGWRLNDYRKQAPQELASNPELYQRLLEEEKEYKPNKNN